MTRQRETPISRMTTGADLQNGLMAFPIIHCLLALEKPFTPVDGVAQNFGHVAATVQCCLFADEVKGFRASVFTFRRYPQLVW